MDGSGLAKYRRIWVGQVWTDLGWPSRDGSGLAKYGRICPVTEKLTPLMGFHFHSICRHAWPCSPNHLVISKGQ